MTLTDFQHALQHSPALNYAIGCITTACAIWIIDKIWKAK